MIYNPQHWIAPDADGNLTAWDEDALNDGKPIALAREHDVHPKVWRLLEVTAVEAPDAGRCGCGDRKSCGECMAVSR